MSYSLTKEESLAVYKLAETLTGSCQQGARRRDVLLQNVCRRVTALRAKSLSEYLAMVESCDDEYQMLLSALTIHTTSWFREASHFQLTWDELEKRRKYSAHAPLRIFSAACSTGKEVYSFALMLEGIRAVRPEFDYHITGVDIDPVSIEVAKKAIYPLDPVDVVPNQYRPFLRMGRGDGHGFFTLSKDIRQRCAFKTCDLRAVRAALSEPKNSNGQAAWDLIVCRNVLIYFSTQEVGKIVAEFAEYLGKDGLLCLGHSEAVDASAFGLRSLGHAIYRRGAEESRSLSRKRKMLVVDDSAVVRRVICKLFERSGFDTVEASSAAEATAALKVCVPDVITLDLNMPGKDGSTWLAEQRAHGLRVPVILVSEAAPLEAGAVFGVLEHGAQDYIEERDLHDHPEDTVARVSAVVDHARDQQLPRALGKSKMASSVIRRRPDLIVIGASTGGTEALTTLLRYFPKNAPPIIVVQHITPMFAAAFAHRLADAAGLELGQAESGDVLKPGTIHLALGDYHVGVKCRRDGKLELTTSKANPVGRHRPAVDVLFSSVAACRVNALGIILTGMGRDGAEGLLQMQSSGCQTMAQDEDSCVVFGMPREAIQRGAAQFVGNLTQIRQQMDMLLGLAPARVAG